MKSSLKDEEAVGNDVVGQAHIETVALRLFEFADTEDRNARFSKYAYIYTPTPTHTHTHQYKDIV